MKLMTNKNYKNPMSGSFETNQMNHIEYEEKFHVKKSEELLSMSSSPLIVPQLSQSASILSTTSCQSPSLLSSQSQSVVQNNNIISDEIQEIQQQRAYQLEDFIFYKILGQGAFGVVFLSIDKKTNEEVAVKMISKHEIEVKQQREHTQTEKLILEHITHPFLINVLGTFQDRKNIYFVMRVLKGGELFQHLKSQRYFPEERVKFYAAQMILAIEHLHSMNIIYRDLKLENILLDNDGYICLTDFGLAKILRENEPALTFCGTPEYLSPETIKGCGSSKASDWWSFGTLLYEMLYSMPPFYHKQHKLMFQKIIFEDLSFNQNIQVSPQAMDIIRRLLSKDPRIRLGSCEGAQEIKNHPWFDEIDWDQLYLRKINAEFKPQTNQDCWLGYFDQEFITKPINNFFKQIYDFNDLDCSETFTYY